MYGTGIRQWPTRRDGERTVAIQWSAKRPTNGNDVPLGFAENAIPNPLGHRS